MFRKLSLFLTVVFLLSLLPGSAAQSDDKPTVMFLDAGVAASYNIRTMAALDVLQSYGYISEAEREYLNEGQDLEGERLRIIFGNAQVSIGDAFIEIEKALDQGVDVIVAQQAMPAQAAVSATVDMEAPPVVIFATVSNAAAAGIAQTSCIKPAHVTGMETIVPYDEVVSMLLMQDPDMKTVGTIYPSSGAQGAYGAERIVEIATGMGLTVESAAVTAIADVRAAAQGLVAKGVEAIILPLDLITAAAVPIITQVASENELPLFYSSPGLVLFGATIGGGTLLTYEEGAHAGLLLSAYLNGDIDIASTGIHQASNMYIGLNLDSAQLQGVEIADALLERASIVIQDGEVDATGGAERQLALRGRVLPLEERRADDLAMLESMQCSPEMIAEQQAELDAAE